VSIDHSPQALVVSRDLAVADHVQSLLAEGGIRSTVVRDTNEALTGLDAISTHHAELDVIIIDTDVVDFYGHSFDVKLVGEIRSASEDTTVGSARRLRHLPIVVLTDDLTTHTSDEVHAIDPRIPVLRRSRIDRLELLTAVQRRLGAYRHELMESIQRVGFGFVFENGRFTVAAPSVWHGSPHLVRTTHLLADRDTVSAAYQRLLLVTDRWKWGDIVLNQFEALLNDPRATEPDYQQFFEANPSFVLRNDFDAYWAEPKLPIAKSRNFYKPDFVLAPRDRSAVTEWGLVDLKRPDVPLLDAKAFHRDLSKHVYKVRTQLLDYADDYFAKSEHEDALRTRFGVAPRPRHLVAIIGRRPTAHMQRYVQLLGRLPDVQIRTYDDVLDFERAKVELIKKASQPASDEIAVPRLGSAADAGQ
jgi:CheY-like chemotaxis protein